MEKYRFSLASCFLGVAFAPLAVLATSFDCSQLLTNVESLICSSGELSKLDDVLAEVYGVAKSRARTSTQLAREQRRWLAQRDACTSRECIKAAYETRIKELKDSHGTRSTVATPRVPADDLSQFRCELDDDRKEETSSEHKRLRLEVRAGKVTTFFSSWAFASSDPSLRPGYAVRCERNLASFRQTKNSKEIILSYQPNQYEQDHANCKVHVVEGKDDIQIQSEACNYDCLRLDYKFQKDGDVCKTLR